MSEHFKTEEFHCKSGAPYPKGWEQNRLAVLCAELEIIRKEFGDKAVTIISGYRTPAWNKRVGGSRYSQHMEGRAADITIAGVPARKVAAKVLEMVKSGRLNVIKGVGSYRKFTHVDIRPSARLVVWRQ